MPPESIGIADDLEAVDTAETAYGFGATADEAREAAYDTDNPGGLPYDTDRPCYTALEDVGGDTINGEHVHVILYELADTPAHRYAQELVSEDVDTVHLNIDTDKVDNELGATCDGRPYYQPVMQWKVSATAELPDELHRGSEHAGPQYRPHSGLEGEFGKPVDDATAKEDGQYAAENTAEEWMETLESYGFDVELGEDTNGADNTESSDSQNVSV